MGASELVRGSGVRRTDLINRSLVAAVPRAGSAPTSLVRLQVAGIANARRGRLLVVGEDRVSTSAVMWSLVRGPSEEPPFALPCLPTVLRYAEEPIAVVTTADGARRLPTTRPEVLATILGDLSGAGGSPFLELGLPANLLHEYCVVQPPPLHTPGTPSYDEAFSTGTTVLLVTPGRTPLARPELGLLARALASGARCGVVTVMRAGNARWDVDNSSALTTLARETGRALWVSTWAPGEAAGAVRAWLADTLPLDRASDQLALVDALLCRGEGQGDACEESDAVAAAAATGVASAETRTQRVGRSATAWLPTLSFEVGRARSDLHEDLSRALREQEDRFSDTATTGSIGDLDGLPEQVLHSLRGLEARCHDQLRLRLVEAARVALGVEFDPATLPALARPGPRRSALALVSVAATTPDTRTEMMTQVGNFSSGRQSISLLGVLGSAVATPLAIVGAGLGVGFLHLGKQSREEAQLRAAASRWVHAQVMEASRVIRYQLEQRLSEVHHQVNLAAREHMESLAGEARRALADARLRLAEAEEAAEGARTRTAADRAVLERLRAEVATWLG